MQLRVLPMRSLRLSRVLFGAITVLIYFCSLPVAAETKYPYQVFLQGGTYNFEVTTETNDSSDTLSGFGAYSIGVGATIFQKFLVVAGYSLILSDGFTGSTATGLDFGMRYYHWTRPSMEVSEVENLEMSVYNLYNPYVGLAVRSRDFLSTLTSTYLGLGFVAGLDYRYKKDYYLNAEFRYEELESPASKTLVQMNILFGIGVYF